MDHQEREPIERLMREIGARLGLAVVTDRDDRAGRAGGILDGRRHALVELERVPAIAVE